MNETQKPYVYGTKAAEARKRDKRIRDAASELLAACKAARLLLNGISLNASACTRDELAVPEQLRAAIAKAEGGDA